MALVDELEPLSEIEELRNVFETADPSSLAVAESVLRGAGIEFVVKNGALSTILGASYSVGAVQIWVRADDEVETRAVLDSIDPAATSEPPP